MSWVGSVALQMVGDSLPKPKFPIFFPKAAGAIRNIIMGTARRACPRLDEYLSNYDILLPDCPGGQVGNKNQGLFAPTPGRYWFACLNFSYVVTISYVLL